MRPIEWSSVPVSGSLALLTMEEARDGSPAMMADFRDVRALSHRRLRKWIGLSRTRGIRLGAGAPELRDGLWFVEEDAEAAQSVRDLDVRAEDLSLEPIET